MTVVKPPTALKTGALTINKFRNHASGEVDEKQAELVPLGSVGIGVSDKSVEIWHSLLEELESS